MNGANCRAGTKPRNVDKRHENRRYFKGQIAIPLVRDEGVAGSNPATPTIFQALWHRYGTETRAFLDERLVFDRQADRWIKTGYAAIGILSKRTERLVAAYLSELGPLWISIITLANRSPRFRRAVGQETPVGLQAGRVLCYGIVRKGRYQERIGRFPADPTGNLSVIGA